MELREVKVGDGWMKYDDESCYYGMKHLLDVLSWDERKVFFDEAYRKGAAEFEDRERRNYTLYHQHDEVYLLTRRRSDW